jgi:hypothetical protein
MTAATPKLDVGAMMTDELKPCPFCGAHATAPQNITPTKRATWEVSCAIFCVAIRRGSRKEVVESWNKRALLSASEPAVALRDVVMRVEFETWFTNKLAYNGVRYEFVRYRDYPPDRYKTDLLGDYKDSSIEAYWVPWRHCWERVRAMLIESPAAQTERALPDDARDAARYRWLRRQNWNEADMFVVAGSKSQVRLGTDCPGLNRLDDAVDAALTAAQPASGGDR